MNKVHEVWVPPKPTYRVRAKASPVCHNSYLTYIWEEKVDDCWSMFQQGEDEYIDITKPDKVREFRITILQSRPVHAITEYINVIPNHEE